MCTDQGCNYHPTIVLPVKSLMKDRYQFRIQLSCANSCHCVTIGSATHPYGHSIHGQWSNIWGQSGGWLCAANLQKNFYSDIFHFHDDSKGQYMHVKKMVKQADASDTKICSNILSSFPEDILHAAGCLSSTTALIPATSFSSTQSATKTTQLFSSTPTPALPHHEENKGLIFQWFFDRSMSRTRNSSASSSRTSSIRRTSFTMYQADRREKVSLVPRLSRDHAEGYYAMLIEFTGGCCRKTANC